jgi:hypothetical protein
VTFVFCFLRAARFKQDSPLLPSLRFRSADLPSTARGSGGERVRAPAATGDDGSDPFDPSCLSHESETGARVGQLRAQKQKVGAASMTAAGAAPHTHQVREQLSQGRYGTDAATCAACEGKHRAHTCTQPERGERGGTRMARGGESCEDEGEAAAGRAGATALAGEENSRKGVEGEQEGGVDGGKLQDLDLEQDLDVPLSQRRATAVAGGGGAGRKGGSGGGEGGAGCREGGGEEQGAEGREDGQEEEGREDGQEEEGREDGREEEGALLPWRYEGQEWIGKRVRRTIWGRRGDEFEMTGTGAQKNPISPVKELNSAPKETNSRVCRTGVQKSPISPKKRPRSRNRGPANPCGAQLMGTSRAGCRLKSQTLLTRTTRRPRCGR